LHCEIITVGTGKEAIERFDDDIDLVLLDIGLPDIDGFAVSEQLNTKMGENIKPIIAVTAHIFENEKTKCLNFGMKEVVTKPVSHQKLKEIVMKYSDLKSAEQG
jgi:CheY-like chemotaxis protein